MRPLGVEIAARLADQGVSHVFGIPGVHNLELYRGMEAAGLTHVLARHEQGAGFMADGYARATGKPGVAFVISGPGLTNILTPLGQAYSDSVPLLVISACLDRADLNRGTGRLHDMPDQEGAAASVTKWSRTAFTPEAAFHLLDQAFTEFSCARPRPVHIQIPMDVLQMSVEVSPISPTVRSMCAPFADGLQEVVERIGGANRILMILGGGTRHVGSGLSELADQIGAAVFTTYAGKGVVPDSAPLSLGPYLARPESAALIAKADLGLAIGTELSETDLWRTELGHRAPMIRVDIDSAMFRNLGPHDLPVLADAHDFVQAVRKALPESRDTLWKPAKCAKMRSAFRASATAERPRIAPFIDALRASLPAEARVVSDMTQFAYLAKEIFPVDMPRRWFHPVGFGTLGYALPAAIGAKIADENLPLIAIAGDYGFQYTGQELAVAVELGLNLPIILWDNGGLGEIEASMRGAQMEPWAVTPQNPNFQILAKAYGAKLSYIEAPEELGPAMARALSVEGPTLLHVVPAKR